MNIMDKLQAVEDKFLELESLISDPSVLEDMNRWQRFNKEHSTLLPIVEAYREYKKVCQGIDDNKEMLVNGIDDDEFRHMVEEELADFRKRKAELDEELPIMLLPRDPNDDKMLLWKSVVELAAKKPHFSLGIFFGCIPVMLRVRAGR